MEKKYQVFISSTFKDLQEEREEVTKAIINKGKFIPSGMESFPAVDEEAFSYIKRVIDQSDYYLLLVAGKYGSTDAAGISYTEKEYDYAVSKGIKVIALVHGDPGNIPHSKSEQTASGRSKLEKFRRKVMSGRLVRTWKKKEELANHVSASLDITTDMFPSVGWTRGAGTDSIKFYKDREDLTTNTSLGDVLSDALTFEMISFSANVLLPFEDQFRRMVKNRGSIRLVMFDPGEDNDIFYSAIASIIEDDPAMKKQELDLILEKVNKLRTYGTEESVQVKFITQKPLLYNLWIKDRGLHSAEANFSAYSYRGRNFTPVFRSNLSNEKFLEAMCSEFDHVWNSINP